MTKTAVTAAQLLARYDAAERDFRYLHLTGANLRGANLTGADFEGANLAGADLVDADLGAWERGPDGLARRHSE